MGSHDYTLFKHEVKPKYGRTIKAKALTIYLKEGGMGVTKFAHQVFHVLKILNDEKYISLVDALIKKIGVHC